MSADNKPTQKNPWSWIPTLYFAEGIPYIVVMTVSVIMYKRMGISNTDIALYTSWLYLPWLIKPLWSPFVDALKTKRIWITSMQLLIGAGLAGVAFTIPTTDFWQFTLAFFWLLAFSSATHDIAADGFYMLGLSEHDQAWFVGIRSTFYRLAMITGQGLLIIFAGYVESSTGLDTVNLSVLSSPDPIVAALPPADEDCEIGETDFSDEDYFEDQTPTESDCFDGVEPDVFEKIMADLPELASTGKATMQIWPAELSVYTGTQTQHEVDSLKSLMMAWNIAQGLIKPAEPVVMDAAGDEMPMMDEGPGFFASLAATLGIQKGEAVVDADKAGAVGVVFIGVSGDLKDPVVTNFGQTGGDKSIKLLAGDRFEFDQSGKWAMVLVQLDPKLDVITSASFEARSGNITLAWSLTFFILTGMFVFFFVYHNFALPRPPADKPDEDSSNVFDSFVKTFVTFFQKPGIVSAIVFLMFYRFAEAQLVKLASPFLLDAREIGGLALTTGEVGFAYGTVGILALTIGGLLGGFLASRDGLKKWLFLMVLGINLPNVVYVFLSQTMPTDLLIVNICVAVEQFGYGFGFTAYMLYMIYISDGEHKTAHFALCTAFMAGGMMLPGMFSGALQEAIGYQNFFVWVMIATIPAIGVSFLVKINPAFGKKTSEEPAA